MRVKLLELFAGSRSVGRVAEQLGYDVFSVDWKPYQGINLSMDIEYIKPSDIPFIPDVIWLSPDCTTYSIAAISSHRDGTLAVSEYAKKCDRVNKVAIDLVSYYLGLNEDLVYYIENPVGMFRKMPFVKGLEKATVWYCKYGDTRAKPTDIFSNNIYSLFNEDGWIPKGRCFNGNTRCHHESAPRGSKTGTQGKANYYERSRIPETLCKEILTLSITLNKQHT